ncbi:MAG: protein kinase, partial [Deltaproteobacteria bacterium]|nr:protein kinase [Deltaproteobacteria bacterium]
MGTRYVALGPLLSGEGSRAFLGLKITDGEASPCALIWVPERVLSDPELVEQLRRDTSRAAGLDHPNVVRVHGLIEVEEGQARVVEFADGESLRRVLDVSKRLPSNLAARVAADAALGVQYAHLAGNEDGTPLVHGDLRPETLLVSYSGVTKVSGYGALNVAPKEMGGKRVMGRRLHCAPEQILGGRDAVTAQTDVYLLGVILYELLTGVVPFEGEKDFDKAVLNKQPPLLNSEYVPPILRPIIGKAMAKKGPLRYPTAQAFREAIEEAMGELADHAELAAFLDRSFCSDDARAARRRELENGIQEWVVRKGLKLAAPPKPPPPVARKVAVVPLPVAAAIEEAPVAATPAADVGQPAAPPVDVPVGNPAAVPEAASQAPVPALAPASAAEQAPVAAPTATPAPLQAPPSPTAPSVAPNAPPAIARAPAPERVATPRPRREDEHGAASRPAKTTSPWLIALPLAAAAAGLAFWYGRHGQPQPQKIDYPKPSPVVMVAGPDAALEESALAPLVPPAPAPTPTPAAVVLAKADPAPEPALAVIAAKSVDARPTPA